MSIVGIIPSYRPDRKLGETVLRSTEVLDLLQLIVVDDGSGGRYAAPFAAVAGVKGVTVLHLPVNVGTGGAIKHGLREAVSRYPEAKGFVTFDADGQHDPDDVRKVLERFSGNADKLVLGVRDFHDSGVSIPLRSRVGNRVTELVFKFFTGISLSDTQTGLRCYPAALARELMQVRGNRYEFQLEALLTAVGRYECLQVPIRTIYEEDNRRSHFNPICDSIRVYLVFFRFVGAAVVCSVIDYLVFALMFTVSSAVFGSLLVARTVSVSLNFVLNQRKVFRSRGDVMTEVWRFALLAVFLFAASYGGVIALGRWLGVPPLVSKVLVEVALFFFSYGVQRFLIFARRGTAS